MYKIILLSPSAISYIDFDALKKVNATITLVMDAIDAPLLPDELRQYFEGIYLIKGGTTDSPLSLLHEENTKAVIQQIINQDPTADWRILSLAELQIILAARLSAYFGLPTVSEACLMVYQNKVVMKNILQSHGVRVPFHTLIDISAAQKKRKKYFDELVLQLRLPFIVKPSNSAGSYGVFLIRNRDDFERWLDDPLQSGNYSYEAEEYINGKLYHCDTVIHEGNIIFAECAEYSYPNMEFLNNKILSSKILFADNPLRARLLAFAEKVLISLGKLNTVTHMELFVTTSGEIVFLEVGARPLGAMAQLMYKNQFGINLANMYFLTMGGIPYSLDYHFQQYSFWAYFPKVDGILLSCVEPPLKSEYTIKWVVTPGEHLYRSKSLVDYSAQLFVTSPSRTILEDDFNTLCYSNYQPLIVKNIPS